MVLQWRWPNAAAHVPFPGDSGSLQSLMLARLGVLYLLLLVGVLQQIFQGAGGDPSTLVNYGLLVAAFAFSIVEALLPDRFRTGRIPAIIHVLFDTALISFWIHYSGGRENLYSLLYLVEILGVGLILYQRAALLCALASTLGYGFILLWDPPAGAWLIWGFNTTLFFALGFVGGYLSEELHRTNARLAEKSRRVESLLALQERLVSTMPTGLLTVDASGAIGFLNPAASQILGVKGDDVAGKMLSAVAPGLLPFFTQIATEEVADLADEVADAGLAAARDNAHRAFLLARTAQNGSRLQQVVEVQIGANKRILRGDVASFEQAAGVGGLLHKEATQGRVLLFQDVTKLLHLEERLKQNEKLAAVGQLAAGIAHEIRNPLAGMSASIEMLKSSLPHELVAQEDHKLMEIALREIDRLNRLISEFLDYVKPQKLKAENVELAKLIGEVLAPLRQTGKPARVQSLKGGMEVRADVVLTEKLDANAVAVANNEKLKQVIWNLVINALQAMDRAGTVEVGCEGLGNRVRFWVQDQGQGMSEQTLSHLYEPFFTTKEKGTGLGLATAYKIVEALHGEIRVESALGKGTRFEILLPAA